MASRTASKDIITLRGSAAIVSEFFCYAANSILYNRGVYPEESFTKVKKYGLTMLLTQDEGVKSFITNLNAQLSEWLEAGKLQRIVLVIMSKATSEVLERWNFSIQTDPEVVDKGAIKEKSDKEIMREIQAIMRQVASCITYLPCLDEPCKEDHALLSVHLSFLRRLLLLLIIPSPIEQAFSTCWPTPTRTSPCPSPGSRATPSSSTTRRW
ncbi:hypothetical protein GUJ93_ZPchr0014g47080 [Zizania palustris]|uniref:HORMA domain-containing protein n=1 Tax=Zizania palustris TaxID=103762 RepID=A0A8J5W6U2_ZIZPA|nr:hypothetical protein GUJ93_ZPchr0014g47080 [Zizania palustris]